MLLACGGGGGGGGGESGSSSKGSQIELNEYASLIYEGKTEDAALLQSHVPQFISDFYSVFIPVSGLTFDSVLEYESEFLDIEADAEDDIATDCESGKSFVDDRRNNRGGGKLIIEYRSCVLDGTKFDGQLVYDFEEPPEDGPYSENVYISILNITVSDAEESMSLQGEFLLDREYINPCRLEGEAIVYSEYQDKTIQATDICFNRYDLQAQLFDSNLGKISVNWGADRDLINFVGAGSSAADIKLQWNNADRFFETIKVTLRNTGLSDFPVEGEFNLDTILDWPYTENGKPLLVQNINLTVDRLEEVSLDLKDYVADSKDLLLFDYRLTQIPDECEASVGTLNTSTFTFSSGCQGMIGGMVNVNDGTNTVTSYPFEFTVLPLAAQFVGLEKTTINYGEAVSLATEIVNEREDGPFDLSIAYAPAGLSLSSSGVLSGSPQTLLKEGTSHVGIRADNGKESILKIEIAIDVNPDQRDVIPHSEISCDNPDQWVDIDLDGFVERVCKWANTYVVQQFDGVDITNEYVAPSFNESSLIEYAYSQNVDADPEEEIIVLFRDSIVVLEPYQHQILISVLLSEIEGINGFYYTTDLYRIAAGGSNILLGDASELYLFSITEKKIVDQLGNSNGLFYGELGNTDSDPEPEIIAMGVLHDFGHDSRNLSGLMGFRVHFADLVGDDRDELVSFDDSYLESGGRLIELSIFNADDLSLLAETSIEVSYDYYFGYNSFKYRKPYLGGKDQLLFRNHELKTIARYAFEGGSFVKKDELGAEYTNISEFVPGGVIFGKTFFKAFDSDDSVAVSGPLKLSANIGTGVETADGSVNDIYAEVDGGLSILEFGVDGSLNAIVDQGFSAEQIYLPSLFKIEEEVSGDYGVLAVSKVEQSESASITAIVNGSATSYYEFESAIDQQRDVVLYNVDGEPGIELLHCAYGELLIYKESNSDPAWRFGATSEFGTPLRCGITVGYRFGDHIRIASIFYGIGNNVRLYVLEISEGELVEVFSSNLSTEYNSYPYFSIRLQDVVENGIGDEILVFGRSNEHNYSSSMVSVVNQEGGVLESYSLEVNSVGLVDGYFDTPDQCLLVGGAHGSAGNHSRLYEVDLVAGNVIWESESFSGDIVREGIYALPGESQRKMIVTNMGVYFAH